MMVHHEGRAFADDLTRMDLLLLLQWGLRRARSKSFSQRGILLKDVRCQFSWSRSRGGIYRASQCYEHLQYCTFKFVRDSVSLSKYPSFQSVERNSEVGRVGTIVCRGSWLVCGPHTDVTRFLRLQQGKDLRYRTRSRNKKNSVRRRGVDHVRDLLAWPYIPLLPVNCFIPRGAETLEAQVKEVVAKDTHCINFLRNKRKDDVSGCTTDRYPTVASYHRRLLADLPSSTMTASRSKSIRR
jgi:hypothetical protein